MIPRLLALCLVVLGLTVEARAQNATEVQIPDNDRSPYHTELLDYKEGKFQDALDALNAGGDAALQETKVVVLKAQVLTELKRYEEGEKLLRNELAGPDVVIIQEALGDLLLRKRSFARASKYYAVVINVKPNDPDVKLKLIYAEIGAADLVSAGKLASQLTPLDPKNPYDDHASYYFAQAALAQAAGRTQEAEDQIQAARTNYGITVTNRYLKTYLQVFDSSAKNAATDITPSPRAKTPEPKK